MSRYVTVLPSARRLMESLRDIGYDLPSAVADLVDNSIDAGAGNIDIQITSAGPESWIRIVDDGLGMSGVELDEAMRYGSNHDYAARALGHFGLGLKTGSLSQCRRLTVASRRNVRGRVQARRWDLDLVAERDSWDLDAPRVKELPKQLLEPLRGRTGTVVLWEKLDRVLAFRNPAGAPATRALETTVRDIGSHLAMVFHRFLSGEYTDGQRALTIRINGDKITAWDPFCRGEPRTRTLSEQRVSLPLADGRTADLVVQPYVLPAQTQFSSAAAHQAAGGPSRWNRQQGFYIYRRERLIQSGGWNRLRTFDEHAKLARIAIDLPVGHEDLFGINVAKMSVSIPEAARPPLRAIASAVVQDAQRSYREHLHQAVPAPEPFVVPDHPTEPKATPDGPTISGDWPVILRTVSDELEGDPVRRDSLLRRLANAFG